MSEFVNTIDLLGDEETLVKLLEDTLEELKDNVVTKVSAYALSYKQSLKRIVLPSVTTVEHHGISRCKKLESVEFLARVSFDTQALYNCSKLATLILRSNTMCEAKKNNVLNSTPISSGTGYIYSPRALVDSYKNDYYWKLYANQFRALEDFTVDGTTTGELDSSKI